MQNVFRVAAYFVAGLMNEALRPGGARGPRVAAKRISISSTEEYFVAEGYLVDAETARRGPGAPIPLKNFQKSTSTKDHASAEITLDHSQMAEKEDGSLAGSQRSSLRTSDHGPFHGLRSRVAAFGVVPSSPDASFGAVATSLLGSGGGSGNCFETSKHKHLPTIRSLKPY